MSVAVVGAAGFLGTYLVNGLLAEGFKTTAIYNRSPVTTAMHSVHIDDFREKPNQFDSIFISLGNYSCNHHELININKLIEEILGKNLNNNSFLPNLIKNSQHDNKIRIFGDGSRKQDYLHVDDAVQLCIKAMNSQENGIFLGASGNSTSNLEVASIVAQYHGSEIIFEGKETGASFSFNVDKTKNLLKWTPTVNIKEGILSML